jgi:hypothetical protein
VGAYCRGSERNRICGRLRRRYAADNRGADHHDDDRARAAAGDAAGADNHDDAYDDADALGGHCKKKGQGWKSLAFFMSMRR